MIIIFVFLSVVLGILFSDLVGYLWHIFAHQDAAFLVKETHYVHHNSDLTHEAHQDFFWVILLLIITGFVLFGLLYFELLNIPLVYILIFCLTTVIVFIWNWYLHSAYHISNHWLGAYQWFQNDKAIHFQHHTNPRSNYGIASHYWDVIFGTYQYPFSIIKREG